MTEPIRVFVNERPVLVPPGAAVAEAVAALDPSLAEALATGRAYSTDGVGRPLPAGTSLVAGAIVRVVVSARGAGPG